MLPDLLAAYRERLLEHQQRRARRSDDGVAARRRARRGRSSASLAQVTGRTVTLSTRVDPAIIGGLVARVGGTVYDGSVTRSWRRCRSRLVRRRREAEPADSGEPQRQRRSEDRHDGHQS